MASGQILLLDHIRFIPVYVMGSTFLTTAWPSLFRSLGLLPKTLDDTGASHEYTRVPMSEVLVDDGTNEDTSSNDSGTGNLLEDWFQGSQRHHHSPLLVATPNPSEQQETQTSKDPTPYRTTSPGLIHMGPSSNYSAGTRYTGTSISLGSQGGCPSEMSSNVARHFFQGLTPNRHLFTTQRRSDIESLGRGPYSRQAARNLAKGVRDEPDLVNTVLRKAQSL